jgi:hypothetical protein
MRRFSPSIGATHETDLQGTINKLNSAPAVRLPNTMTIRVVPDTPSVLPKFGFGQPQFIQTLSDDGGKLKEVLAKAMDAHNQTHWNIQREMNLEDTMIKEAQDRTRRANARIWYKA